MLKFSEWKLFSIIIIILLSIYFSIPSFFYKLNNINFFPNQKVNFGLDLKGGTSMTIQANLEEYISEKFAQNVKQIKTKLIDDGIKLNNFEIQNNTLKFLINNEINVHKIENIIDIENFDIQNSNNQITIKFNDDYLQKLNIDVLNQSIEIIRKRVDSSGTKEVEIQVIGNDKILLQVPGITNPEEIKKIIGKTARLTFHLVINQPKENLTDAERVALLINSKVLPTEDGKGALILESQPLMTGDMLETANISQGNLGEPVIRFRLDNLGREIFADITSNHSGKMLAIVLDNKIISFPTINEPILGGEGNISGNFTKESASELALLLKAGSLPVPLDIVEERIVGPTLGLESISAGFKACIIAAILVFVIMIIYYKFFGLIASLALLINLIMIVAALSVFNATLTLPGIAGIVLTLGMAVDANVLIFERIKEELKKGMMPLNALHNGYHYAFVTIFDSNITTIFAAVILYIFGTGPVKGFAVTLIIGILCSMFTSISVTKIIISLWYKIKKPKKINI